MSLECIKYKWETGTEDIDINFFSPGFTEIDRVELMDFYIDGTMSNIEYSFENITSGNILAVESSSFTFDCIKENNIDGINLFDFFEIFNSNKYVRWIINVYNDDDGERLWNGIIYKDGIEIHDVASKVLSITCLGFEREFKTKFGNEPLVPTDTINYTNWGFVGVKRLSFIDCLRKNFPNVAFNIQVPNFQYSIASHPFTYAPAPDKFETYNNFIHIKTGYQSFVNDGIDKFSFLDSLLKPMGWIWYFYQGELIIQERANEALEQINIDCAEVEVNQSISHNYNEFQVDNIVIDSGQYFISIDTLSTNTQKGGKVFVYSNTNIYYNRTVPFQSINYDGFNGYTLIGQTIPVSYLQGEDKYSIRVVKVSNSSEEQLSYPVQKTLRLTPYVNREDRAGAFNLTKARTTDATYYSNGNFIKTDAQILSVNDVGYTGTAAESLIYAVPYSNPLRYRNYEAYAQTETFKKNFKKFLKTNDEVICSMDIQQLLYNPLVTIQFSNYQDADFRFKFFSILKLAFHPINKNSQLILQMQ